MDLNTKQILYQTPVEWYIQTAINHYYDDYALYDVAMYPARYAYFRQFTPKLCLQVIQA